MVMELENRRDVTQWFRGLSPAKRRLLRMTRARDFACPRASAGCPMRALLAACPRHDVRFLARGDR